MPELDISLDAFPTLGSFEGQPTFLEQARPVIYEPTATPVFIRPEASNVAESEASLRQSQNFNYGTSTASSMMSFSGVSPAASLGYSWRRSETEIPHDRFQTPVQIHLIPEPRTYGLFFGVGMLGLVPWRRKIRAFFKMGS